MSSKNQSLKDKMLLFAYSALGIAVENPFLPLFLGQKRLFNKIIFFLEFNERCLKRIARPLGNAQNSVMLNGYYMYSLAVCNIVICCMSVV
ncbi:hypothetical protein B0A77_04040 [Flavobacterium branchiophilum]|uniref:Uncharacterized protein n=1 Tax=Flavobacterium branchiophilum TaxID=55197 RepID=A0A2H3KPD8_9FLAO|nr:hypothetical protein B0A77_04040 [Flavobacterium branchiophilum]